MLIPLTKAVYAACVTLHVLELLVPPPLRYPDIFPVFNVLICTPVFVLVWLWSIKCGVEIGWALGGLPGTPNPVKSKPSNGPTMHHDWKGGSEDSIGRETGARTTSLGFSRGRRKESYRSASVGADAR